MGELSRAIERGSITGRATQSLSELLTLPSTTIYLEAAERGELRRRAVTKPHTASDASRMVREDCLLIIGRAAQIPVTLPERADRPILRPVIAARPRSILMHHLEEQADRPGQSPARIRLLALLGVVMDTGARAGELCRLEMKDISPDLTTVWITRRPQNRNLNAVPQLEIVTISAPTRSALRAWLKARADLVALAEGNTKNLLVTVVAGHTHAEDGSSVPRPPGMPLMPRGLARAYTRAIEDLNAEMVGEPGWEPMPPRMEQLRRAIELEVAEDGAVRRVRRADH
jgi:integrase